MSKLAYVEVRARAGKMVAAQFPSTLVASVPFATHTILTDTGIQFTNRQQVISTFERMFDRVCRENEIDHRLTKVPRP
ncbi:MAG: hypothetical protein MJH10_13610 [Epibacterium sp.]|nr:hypothetical protein [Epibacterium sp.]